MTVRIVSQVQAPEVRFCEGFSCVIRKALNVEPLLGIESSRRYIGSAMCLECLRKDWRDKSCWLHPRESGPEVVQGPGGATTSPTLLSRV